MYDLNEHIRIWKSSYVQNAACTREDVQELEDHLRDQIQELIQNGLTEEEAFQIARMRIGDPDALCGQFAEADSRPLWRKRFSWMGLGIFFWFATSLLQGTFSGLSVSLALAFGVPSGQSLGVVHAISTLLSLAFVVLAVKTMMRNEHLENWRCRFSRLTATKTGILLFTTGLLLIWSGAKLISFLPTIYAARVLSADQLGSYAVYSSISGTVLRAFLLCAVVVFVAHHGRSAGDQRPSTL